MRQHAPGRIQSEITKRPRPEIPHGHSRHNLFSAGERENGKAAWLLGASFISEGAIPFAAADPLRVIPASMLGAATTGAIVMATGAELSAPHGGIFVSFAIDGVLGFFIALIAGLVVSGIAVVALKQFTRRAAVEPAVA